MAEPERRAEARTPTIELLRFYDYAKERGKTVPSLNFALTSDLSDTGLSFSSLKPLSKDERLTLVNYELWKNPKDGVVRWCSEVSSGVFKVGVSLS